MADGMHVVMLPWLAFGHMIPFLHLSIALAKAGIRISFLTTSRNIQRLPRVPSQLTDLIKLVELPLPAIEGLPEGVEATVDIHEGSDECLKKAFDLSFPAFERFIANDRPDWIVHDIFPCWTGRVARKSGIPRMFFSAYSAAVLAFVGPVDSTVGEDPKTIRPSPTSLASPPPWLDFKTSVAFRPHEAEGAYHEFYTRMASGISTLEYALQAWQGSEAMAVRSCTEFEGEYLGSLRKLHPMPILPVGLLPPTPPTTTEKREKANDPKWADTLKWLGEQPARSVVFVVFGTECKLSRDQVHEIAHGLELSNLPFLWALRRPIWAHDDDDDALPLGFIGRIVGRGRVFMGWAPQMEILAHPAIGGSLFHAGWGSTIELLQYGHGLIVLPMANIQPLDARLLVDRGIAIQVEVNKDGSLCRDAIAWSLRRAMVEEEGESIRLKSMEMKAIFSDQKLHEDYLCGFIDFLKTSKSKQAIVPK